MKISQEQVKSLLKAMDYHPEDGVNNIYYKKYSSHNNYIIRVNFNTRKIEYRENNVKAEDGIRWGDLTTSNFENSENFVVLECIDRLLEKGYAPKNLYLEYKFPLGRNEKGKLDILVFDNDGKAYLMIECKTWGAEFTKEEKKMLKDGGQLFSYYVQDKATKYLCLYTSQLSKKNIEYKNNIIKVDEAWAELTNQKEIHDHWNKNTKDNGIFEEWANAYDVEIKALVRSRLLPLTKDDSGRIFNQFAEILRHNVVSDKPNAFNKILNLFICKIIDEDKNDNEQVEFQWLEDDTDESLQIRLNDLYKQGMSRFLDIDVTDFSENDIANTLINISDSNAQKAIRDMFVKLRLQKNPEFAFIEVYDDTSFKLNARVVREVVELLQPYQFRYGHKQQFLGDFFELLLNTSIKQEAGQYFTPVPITRYIISSLPIKEMIEKKLKANEAEMLPSVIDFACGTGHFLTEYMDKVQSIIENEIDISKAKPIARKKLQGWIDYDKFGWAGDYVYGIDADYRLVKSSKVSSFLNGDGEANIIRANGLDHFEKSKEYKGKLKMTSNEDHKDNAQFDILIANPPYAVNAFKSTVKFGDESFELFNKFTDSSSEIECLFIERMKQLLKVGGFAGVILPSSVLSNTGIYTATREILLKYFKVVAITEFGSNTFMATNTNTVTLFLERRPNSDYQHIQVAVNNFFEKRKDFTVLGVEKAFSKYVANVFDGVSFEDYISFIEKKPTQKIIDCEIYNDYCVWFENLPEVKKLKDTKSFRNKSSEDQKRELKDLFYGKVLSMEREKVFSFLLTYGQKTIITRVGEKQEEKLFLGYEFSKTRGHEGIKALPDGTSLYDEEDQLNCEKANYYVYSAYRGEYPEISENMQTNISTVDTNDLINLRSVPFEKVMNLNAGLKLEFDTKYPLERLQEYVHIQRGVTYDKDDQIYRESENVILTADNITLANKLNIVKKVYLTEQFVLDDKTKLMSDDLFMCMSSGSRKHVGKIAYIENDMPYHAGGFMGILRKNDNSPKNVMRYIYSIMSMQNTRDYFSKISTGSNIKNLNDFDLNIRLPMPPQDIRDSFVSEIEEVETSISSVSERLIKAKADLQIFVDGIEQTYSSKTTKVKYVANLNPEKPDKTAFDKHMLVSFVDMPSVSEDGYIKKATDRPFGTVISGGYTCFQNGDIIIAKITPCMENGKCALVTGMTNNYGFGSTEFHVIRANEQKILAKFLFTMLNREKVRLSAKANMTGASGHKRVPEQFYSNLDIIDIDIEKQKEIVSQVEKIESEITALENEIASAEERKQAILEKYLK